MSKIRDAKGVGNGTKRQPRASAGIARNRMGELRRMLNDTDALRRLLRTLSARERKLVRTDFQKLPFKRQEEIYRTLEKLGGPAVILQLEILEDYRAWADRLPALKDEPPILSEEELREIYAGAGVSEEDARAMAASEVKRPLDDILREAHAGAPPEVIERKIADHKRDAKMNAVFEVVGPAVSARAKRDAETKLRTLANESWKRSEKIATDTRRLSLCLYDFDEVKNGQRGGLEPVKTEWAKSEWTEFRETVSAGAGLSDVLAALSDVAEALAREMKAIVAESSTAIGRPKDEFARLAAEKLREFGLNPTQSAEFLERADLADYETQYAGRKGRQVTDLLRKSSRKPLRK